MQIYVAKYLQGRLGFVDDKDKILAEMKASGEQSLHVLLGARRPSDGRRLENARQGMSTGSYHQHPDRCGPVLPDLDHLLESFEPTLRRWQRLTPQDGAANWQLGQGDALASRIQEEQESDPFANCLLGPFEQSAKTGAAFQALDIP